eukprot:scaffold40592_cov63-Phaeocystis_antarctica.AAC.2
MPINPMADCITDWSSSASSVAVSSSASISSSSSAPPMSTWGARGTESATSAGPHGRIVTSLWALSGPAPQQPVPSAQRRKSQPQQARAASCGAGKTALPALLRHVGAAALGALRLLVIVLVPVAAVGRALEVVLEVLVLRPALAACMAKRRGGRPLEAGTRAPPQPSLRCPSAEERRVAAWAAASQGTLAVLRHRRAAAPRSLSRPCSRPWAAAARSWAAAWARRRAWAWARRRRCRRRRRRRRAACARPRPSASSPQATPSSNPPAPRPRPRTARGTSSPGEGRGSRFGFGLGLVSGSGLRRLGRLPLFEVLPLLLLLLGEVLVDLHQDLPLLLGLLPLELLLETLDVVLRAHLLQLLPKLLQTLLARVRLEVVVVVGRAAGAPRLQRHGLLVALVVLAPLVALLAVVGVLQVFQHVEQDVAPLLQALVGHVGHCTVYLRLCLEAEEPGGAGRWRRAWDADGDGVGRGVAAGRCLRSCRSAFSSSSASSSPKKLSSSVLSVYIPTASSRISSCICCTSSCVNGGSSSSPSARGTSSISRSSERSLGSSSVAGAQDADPRAGDSSSAMLG